VSPNAKKERNGRADEARRNAWMTKMRALGWGNGINFMEFMHHKHPWILKQRFQLLAPSSPLFLASTVSALHRNAHIWKACHSLVVPYYCRVTVYSPSMEAQKIVTKKCQPAGIEPVSLEITFILSTIQHCSVMFLLASYVQ